MRRSPVGNDAGDQESDVVLGALRRKFIDQLPWKRRHRSLLRTHVGRQEVDAGIEIAVAPFDQPVGVEGDDRVRRQELAMLAVLRPAHAEWWAGRARQTPGGLAGNCQQGGKGARRWRR